eukprot:NODE_114_length_19305_cov_0.149849.p6 type:complete len:320 gc:universal NODE_114_length_19305_cov_0.149849:11504-12463(+)
MESNQKLTKVFAQAPGYPHWPGFITENAPDYVYTDGRTKNDYFCVFFFNSWDYQLFEKLSPDVLEHVQKCKSTLPWDENYEKFLKINKNKKRYITALEEGKSWSDADILLKLKNVVEKRRSDDEKRAHQLKKKLEKVSKPAPVSKKRKSAPTVDLSSRPNKRSKVPVDPLKNLVKIKTYLDSKIFTYPNNENIPIEKVKQQVEKLKSSDVNFEILKDSKIGKMVKKISKLTGEDLVSEKHKKNHLSALPPKEQIELLIESGVIKECKNLVSYWTTLLSNLIINIADQGIVEPVDSKKTLPADEEFVNSDRADSANSPCL